MVTLDQLCAIMLPLERTQAEEYYPILVREMTAAGITTVPLMAAFLATIGHESNGLTEFIERGVKPGQYDGRTDLGNTKPGDGCRYCGRGPGMNTGLDNYRYLSQVMGIDLVTHPELLEQPKYGFRAAAEYWKAAGCARWAAAGNLRAFRAVSELWNAGHVGGSVNGWDSRQIYYTRCQSVLKEIP